MTLSFLAVNSCVGVVTHLDAVEALDGIIVSVEDAGVDVRTALREISIDDVIVLCSMGSFDKIGLVVSLIVTVCDAAAASVVGIDVSTVLPAGVVLVSFVANFCVGVVIRLAAVTADDGVIFCIVGARVDVLTALREVSVNDVIVVCSVGLVKIGLVVLATVAIFDAAVVVGVEVGAVLHVIKVAPSGDIVVYSTVNSSVGVVTTHLVAETSVNGISLPVVGAVVDVVLTVL